MAANNTMNQEYDWMMRLRTGPALQMFRTGNMSFL